MSMETTSINLGRRPASANQVALNAIFLKLSAALSRHAQPATGSALLALGVLLSSGAQTVGAALICAAVILAGAGILYVDNNRKGGEA